MARGRSPKYDDQRAAILICAAFLFAQHGYSSTSMNEVAERCGLSKAALYHYFQDKYTLLVTIAESHLTLLETVVDEVLQQKLNSKDRLYRLIVCFVEKYAEAQNEHMVLTEGVRFLREEDRERIYRREKKLVDEFSAVITELRPEISSSLLSKPITMLLFGMMNWMFTWLKKDGGLTYEEMAPVVADLFFGGFAAVRIPVSSHQAALK